VSEPETPEGDAPKDKASSDGAPRRVARDLTQGSVSGHLMRFVLPMTFGIAEIGRASCRERV